MCWLFTVGIKYRLSNRSCKSFSRSLEQFFLIVDQNNFRNKILFHSYYKSFLVLLCFRPKSWHVFGGKNVERQLLPSCQKKRHLDDTCPLLRIICVNGTQWGQSQFEVWYEISFKIIFHEMFPKHLKLFRRKGNT